MCVATSVEQSKELIELGIPENTADMCYIKEQWYDEEKGEVCSGWSKYPVVNDDESDDNEYLEFMPAPETLPAWSLNALLKLVKHFSFKYDLCVNNWYCTCSRLFNQTISFYRSDLITGAIDMLKWLIKNDIL